MATGSGTRASGGGDALDTVDPLPSSAAESETWGIRSATLRTSAVAIAILVAPVPAGLVLRGLQPGLTAPEPSLWLGAGVLCGIGLGIVVLWLLRMARLGLRLEARPEALRFQLGREALRIPWSDVEHAARESRSMVGGQLPVLAIHLSGAGYRFPRSVALRGSEPTCLCIQEDYLGAPGDEVAAALNAARDRYRGPAGEGTPGPASETPRARPREGSPDTVAGFERRGRSAWGRFQAALVHRYGEEDGGRFALLSLLAVPAYAILMVAWVVTGDLLTAWVVGVGGVVSILAIYIFTARAR